LSLEFSTTRTVARVATVYLQWVGTVIKKTQLQLQFTYITFLL